MGKGDKKSRKGKIHIGSYGISRQRKKKKHFAASFKKRTPVKPVEITEVKEIVEAQAVSPESVVEISETAKKKTATKKPVAKKEGDEPETEGEMKPKRKSSPKKNIPKAEGESAATEDVMAQATPSSTEPAAE